MQTLIKTQLSSLMIQPFENKNLITLCVDDIKDKLLVNPPIIVYGKPATQHRSIGFFSDTSIGYHYSGQLARSIPLTPNLIILLEQINAIFDSKFNGILVNKYNNGHDYIGAHSDDESNLDLCGVVCISYGAIRKFRIRDKSSKKIVIDIPTIPCEIMHMAGNFQKEFTHEIPTESKIHEMRYSFTFRNHKR